MPPGRLPISPALSIVLDNGATLNEIRDEIDSHMEQGSNDASRFVTKESLLEIWTDSRLEMLCQQMADPDETKFTRTIDILKTNLLRTLSILVSIHWSDWRRFRRIFFDSRYSADGERVDRKIKFYTEAELAGDDFLGCQRLAREFLRIRDGYFPIVIKKGRVKILQKGRRLPFVQQEEGVVELGSGGYGTVTKVVIARHRYHVDGTPKPVIYAVARKVLCQEDDFKREVGNLAALRSALSEHTRIAPFLAIISIGDEFNILSELALMNLEEFLGGRHTQFEVTPERLMSELTALSNALKWLHEGIYIPRDGDSKSQMQKYQGPKFCCHMDLKPENILIYQSSQSKQIEAGVGIWKISDFGISRIKDPPRARPEAEATRTAADLLSVPGLLGDLKKKMTSRSNHTRAQRPAGTWTAPEVHRSAEKVVGRESDVWSFGCILVLVCALALGPDSLDNLQSMRGKTADGHSYDDTRGDCFYESSGDGSFVLNTHIATFIDSLPGRPYHNPWFLKNCQALILSTLAIQPEGRITASKLHEALDAIFEPPPGSASMSRSHLLTSPEWRPSLPRTQIQILNPINAQPNASQIIDYNESTALPPSDNSGSNTGAGLVASNDGYADEVNSQVNDAVQSSVPAGITSLPSLDRRNRSPKGKQRAVSESPVSDEDEVEDLSLKLTLARLDGVDGDDFPFGISNADQPGSSAYKTPSILVTPETCSDQSKDIRPKPSGNTLSSTLKSSTSTYHAELNSENQHPYSSLIDSSEQDFAIKTRSTLPATVNSLCTSPDSPEKSHHPSKTGKIRRVQTVPKAYSPGKLPLLQKSKGNPPVLNSPTRQSSIIEQPTSLRPPYRLNSGLTYQPSIRSATSNLSGLNSSRFSDMTGTLVPTAIRLHHAYPGLGNTAQTILSPTGKIVAFLSPKCIHIYPIYGDIYQRRDCVAPPGWKWISASISGEFLLAKGQLRSNSMTKFQLYQARTVGDGHITIEKKDSGPDCVYEDGVVSPDGYILYQEQTQVCLVNLENPTPLPLEVGFKIKRSWFNATGSWAFAWFVVNDKHHVKAWKVTNPEIHFEFSHRIPEHERFGTPVQSILSFPNSRALLLWKAHNKIMAVAELPSNRWLEGTHLLKDLQALTISPTEHCIVYIRSKRKWQGLRFRYRTTLYIRKIDFDPDGNISFGKHRKGVLQHHFQHDGSCIAAVQSVEEHVIHVFVSHCNGHVEKVIFDERELF